MTRAAFGFRAHSGWAAVVAVANPPQSRAVLAEPVVVDRRRIELVDAGVPGSVQPYHAAAEMDPQRAEEWVKRCRERARLLAQRALDVLIGDLKSYHVVACGILLASGRPLPDLAATLASHALIHTAKGELFRDALRRASGQWGLPVTGVKEREVYTRCADEFGMKVDTLGHRVTEMGRAVGSPWRQDEKLAALAGWLALAAEPQR